MTPISIILAALGVVPPVVFAGGWPLDDLQAPSFSWSYSDRDATFGFGSSPSGDWSFGEIRGRRPVAEVVVPMPAATIIGRDRPYLVPVPRRLWRRMARHGLIGTRHAWP